MDLQTIEREPWMEAVEPVADVPMAVHAVLDRRKMRFSDVVSISVGDILPLTRSAGENIDIYASDVLLCYGEIVVIENSLGVRVTDFYTAG